METNDKNFDHIAFLAGSHRIQSEPISKEILKLTTEINIQQKRLKDLRIKALKSATLELSSVGKQLFIRGYKDFHPNLIDESDESWSIEETFFYKQDSHEFFDASSAALLLLYTGFEDLLDDYGILKRTPPETDFWLILSIDGIYLNTDDGFGGDVLNDPELQEEFDANAIISNSDLLVKF